MTSSKIKLPNITLIALTDKKIPEHKRVLRRCMEHIEFGKVVLLSTDEDSVDIENEEIIYNYKIAPLKSIDAWNRSIIYEMPRFVETSHAMLIHDDGYIKHPELWNPDWLHYDYIGAPWPLPQDDYSYRSESGKVQRVGNSVSLRSKRLMDLASTRPLKYLFGNNNEDGHISCHNREWLEGQGCRFAPLEVAVHFSKEHEIPENVGLSTFAFHSL